MASSKSPLKWKVYLGVIFASILALGMCQDRIIGSNLDLDDEESNSIEENSIIPDSLLIQLGTVQNVSDLFHRFVTFGQLTPMQGPSVTSVENATERRALASATAATISQPANCQPQRHVVELDKPENGAIIFWPSCVRVRRCGGCCISTLLTCKPLATSILNVTVLQIFYNSENPNHFESQGTRTFSLEQHDRCNCSCKQVAEDCDLDVHEYKQHECRCVCKNKEEAALCTGPKKIWDSRDCKCKCRKYRRCSTPSRYFNEVTCRCEIQDDH